MKVAIDKNTIGKIKDLTEFEYIYIFKDEPLEELLNLECKCVKFGFLDEVDINLSSYEINCLKKANISDKNWKVKPKLKQNKFAIIIPNYNNDRGNYQGKTYLQNCIESVLNQTYKNFELIIVDDLSTDTSVETVESYKDERIHLIKNTRKRYNGGSRNVGIEYAKQTDADYICFIDSDDWWKHNEVLEHINKKMFNNDMMILGCEMLHKNGVTYTSYNRFDTYEDVFFCINKVWCTAWSRVIKKDKCQYFCEDTLMEDRVWAYRQADVLEFNKITNLNEIVYVWNRLNVDNSVSIVRGPIWEASAWCHIGHQKQLLTNLRHIEMYDRLQDRIKQCIKKVNDGIYQQF